MKRRMIETSILRHFDQTRETILEIDSFNYVNDEVLSQYDDEEVLYSIIFYSKNMSFAECNYEIYDKELLVIIWAFEHWWLELKLTDISIKMFIDHQALISLMKDKELSRRQMRWIQLQNNVLLWQTEHQDRCINSSSLRCAQRFRRWARSLSMNHYSDFESNENCWSREEHQWINL